MMYKVTKLTEEEDEINGYFNCINTGHSMGQYWISK